MSNIQKDLVVIGGGPAGYIAAIKAARLGASVLLAEKKRVGGTCLNEGCIPTKYYVQSQHTISALTNAASRGITISDATFTIDMGQAVKGKNRTVTKLVKGVEYLLKEAKVETVNQKATIIGEHSVQLEDGRVVEAKHILITSGSIPARIPVEGIDSPLVIDSEKILDLEYLPKRLVVIGGGVIGVEFASIFNSFGSEVTIVEALPSLLQNFDDEQIDLITKNLKRKGVTIHTGITVNKAGCQTSLLWVIGAKLKLSASTSLLTAMVQPIFQQSMPPAMSLLRACWPMLPTIWERWLPTISAST